MAGLTGFEPAVFALTGRRVGPGYTTTPLNLNLRVWGSNPDKTGFLSGPLWMFKEGPESLGAHELAPAPKLACSSQACAAGLTARRRPAVFALTGRRVRPGYTTTPLNLFVRVDEFAQARRLIRQSFADGDRIPNCALGNLAKGGWGRFRERRWKI